MAGDPLSTAPAAGAREGLGQSFLMLPRSKFSKKLINFWVMPLLLLMVAFLKSKGSRTLHSLLSKVVFLGRSTLVDQNWFANVLLLLQEGLVPSQA